MARKNLTRGKRPITTLLQPHGVQRNDNGKGGSIGYDGAMKKSQGVCQVGGDPDTPTIFLNWKGLGGKDFFQAIRCGELSHDDSFQMCGNPKPPLTSVTRTSATEKRSAFKKVRS